MSEFSDRCSLQLEGQNFILDSRKAIYWQETHTIILSDLHLGKAGHFRKSGIPIPTSIHDGDLFRLDSLISDYQPTRVLFLGDLFHSDFNEEWNQFKDWLKSYPNIRMVLVRGNHDILSDDVYRLTELEMVDELIESPFHFTHDSVDTEIYNISGHVHPGIRLIGKARQGATLPCFCFGTKSALLPAFGDFTGTYKIRPDRNSRIYAVAEGMVFAMKH